MPMGDVTLLAPADPSRIYLSLRASPGCGRVNISFEPDMPSGEFWVIGPATNTGNLTDSDQNKTELSYNVHGAICQLAWYGRSNVSGPGHNVVVTQCSYHSYLRDRCSEAKDLETQSIPSGVFYRYKSSMAVVGLP